MAINKVVYGGQTLVDLTNDDVTAADVAEGVYFHSADGTRNVGTMTTSNFVVVERQYANISVPSALYVKIDELSNRIDTTKYDLVSMTTKGWSGVAPLEVVVGSNGNDVYVMGRSQGTINSMGVRYVFIQIA